MAPGHGAEHADLHCFWHPLDDGGHGSPGVFYRRRPPQLAVPRLFSRGGLKGLNGRHAVSVPRLRNDPTGAARLTGVRQNAGREAGPSEADSNRSRVLGFPQVYGYPRLSSARKDSRCSNRPQLMPEFKSARCSKQNEGREPRLAPRLGTVGCQPLGRYWRLSRWASSSAHCFRDHLRRWPHCRAMAGWSGMSVAGPLATGSRPAEAAPVTHSEAGYRGHSHCLT